MLAVTGMEQFRVADVAVEAGVSAALVSYYYPKRADLVREAFVYADARTLAWLDGQISDITPARQRLIAHLTGLLDLDSAPRESWLIWIQAWVYGRFHEEFAPLVRERYESWLDAVEDLIKSGVEDGSIPTTRDTRAVATEIAVVSDGFGPPLLNGLITRDDALRVIERAVNAACEAAP